MEKYLYVIADSNDGDYVYSLNKISDETLNTLQPLFEAIKNFESYKVGLFTHESNFPVNECHREDLGQLSAIEYYVNKGISEEIIELFIDDYLPYHEYGTHTVNSIQVLEIASIQNIINK